jgi:2-keto-4-pentenoate hydratase/2-oxohepta-3-ene-1,7-dioic acid hydratase in catechol pathway
MTGTPEGVGPAAPGDVMDRYVERIGHVSAPVRLRTAR